MEKEKIVISRFEYDLLCLYLRQGFKYMARDLDGECCVFLRKPIKVSLMCQELAIWSEPLKLKKHEFDSLGSIGKIYFKFIKWEYEEPTKIQDLIKAYELQERN